jgi:hypothetical protein
MSHRKLSIHLKLESLTLAAFMVAILAIFASGSASAKGTPPMQFCVNHAGSGGCLTTIQGAVDMVPAGGSAVIMIAADVTPYAEDISVDNQTISFVGDGPGSTIIDGVNASGLPTFQFQSNSNGELHGLTIEFGRGGGGGSNINFDQFGKKNKGVGSLKIENCLITGSVHPSNFAPEGSISFSGKLLVIDSSSIVNNSDEGLQINASAKVFITNTTISGNDTTGNHGFASGCGLRLSTGSLLLNNDTITDNHCVGGSGAGQSPTQGGGIYVDFPGKVSMSNTIIANNTVAGSTPGGPDCFSPGKGLKSKGYNLIKNTSDCTIKLAKTDLAPGTDPDLAPLSMCGSNGLLVPPPLGGSPVLNAGNPGKPTGKVGAASTACLPFDECGGARAKGDCAIGANQ